MPASTSNEAKLAGLDVLGLSFPEVLGRLS